MLLKDKGERLALLEIRSHAIWYLKGMTGASKIKNEICQAKDSKEIFELIGEYLENYESCKL